MNVLFCGMCILDSYTGNIRSQEMDVIVTHDSNSFDCIGSFHEIHNPSEVLIITNMPDSLYNSLKTHVLLDTPKQLTIDMKQKGKLQEKVSHILNREVQKEFIHQFYATKYHSTLNDMFSEYRYSCYALCYLLQHVKHCNPDIVDMLHLPTYDRQTNYMHTGNHSLLQLNIIGKHNDSCMLDFLNKCKTTLGRREFNRHMLYPITDKDILEKRYNIIDYIQSQWKDIKQIQNQLGNIHDLERLRRYVIQKQISPAQLITIYSNCEKIVTIYESLSHHTLLQEYLTLNNIDEYCNSIIKDIQTVFDIDIAKDITKQIYTKCFLIRDIDKKLDQYIENSMDSIVILEAIKDKLNNYIIIGKKKTSLIKIDEPKTKGRSLILTDASAIILRKKIPKTTISINYHSNYSNTMKSYELDCSLIHIDRCSTKKGYHAVISDSIIELSESIQESNKKMSVLLEEYI